MENPIKIDNLGVPLFLETPIYVPICYICIAIMLGTGCHRWVILKPPDWEVYDEHVDRQLLGRDNVPFFVFII